MTMGDSDELDILWGIQIEIKLHSTCDGVATPKSGHS